MNTSFSLISAVVILLLSISTIQACNTSALLVGSDMAVSYEDGEWNEVIPENGKVPAGTFVKFKCDGELFLNGYKTRVCKTNGVWDRSTPSCVPPSCNTRALVVRSGMKVVRYKDDEWNPVDPVNGNVPAGTRAKFICDDDLVLDGRKTRRCMSDGDWDPNHATPRCVRSCSTSALFVGSDKSVSYQDADKNTVIPDNGKVPANTSAKFICNDHLFLDGNQKRKCMSDGDWDRATPRCVVRQCDTSALSVGSDMKAVRYKDGEWNRVNPVNGKVPAGTRAKFMCNDDLVLDGYKTRMCMPDGDWNRATPMCARPCNTSALSVGSYMKEVRYKDAGRNPVTPDNGIVPPDTLANFQCKSELLLVGNKKRRCTSNGVWDRATPVCIRLCNTLLVASNMTVSYEDAELEPIDPVNNQVPAGSFAKFGCNDSLELSGSETRECMPDGLWDDATQVCVNPKCDVQSAPAGLTVAYYNAGKTRNPTRVPIGTMARYTCTGNLSYSSDDGYKLISNPRRYCLATGLWNDDPPAVHCVATCQPRPLGDIPSLTRSYTDPDGEAVNYFDFKVPAGTLATFGCGLDFELVGRETAKCLPDRLWSHAMPRCITPACHTLVVPSNMIVSYEDAELETVHPANNTVPTGTFANFGCINNLDEVDGSERSECMEDGSWSNKSPLCPGSGCDVQSMESYISAEYKVTNRTTHDYKIIKPDNSTVPATVPVGTSVMYRCNENGRKLQGSSYRVCANNGLWAVNSIWAGLNPFSGAGSAAPSNCQYR